VLVYIIGCGLLNLITLVIDKTVVIQPYYFIESTIKIECNNLYTQICVCFSVSKSDVDKVCQYILIKLNITEK